ncbi:MAG TPA: ArsR family transcriptional regulator [Anaerolineaceae bacterium]|nr:ArsR family transcriptional regulator [Anaerolineaceae bacterium]
MNTNSYKQDRVTAYDEAFSLDDEKASQLAELFSSLSDPNRLRILSVLLRGETHVQQISETVAMSQSAVPHQLRGLRQMRIVRARKQGRMVYYSLDDDHVKELFLLGLDHVCHE